MTVIEERVAGSPTTRGAGVVAVLWASLFWSFGGVLGKSAGASGVVLSFWRLWIACAVLVAIAALCASTCAALGLGYSLFRKAVVP